jgi:FAD:protein FMN transferase
MDTANSMRLARPLLGTLVEIAASGAADRALQQAIDKAFAAVAQVHRLMSFHDAASDVSRLNRGAAAGAVAVHAWTYQVLQTAAAMHRESAGVFDITSAPVLQKRAAPNMERAGTADAIELLADCRVGYRRPGVRIDLGGIAKGFAVDRAVDVLRAHGLEAGLVNAGGDVAVFGAKPEPVHLRNPNGRLFDPFRSVDVGDCAVVDPRTDRQVHAIAGATVRAPSCMIADALTKVVMIAGERAERLLRRHQASALFVLESGDVWITPDWQNAVRLAA